MYSLKLNFRIIDLADCPKKMNPFAMLGFEKEICCFEDNMTRKHYSFEHFICFLHEAIYFSLRKIEKRMFLYKFVS
jgi:hypothetical protein